jgi:hypothetical protein
LRGATVSAAMAPDEMKTRGFLVAAAVRAAILAKAPRRTIAAVAAAVTSAPFWRSTSGAESASAPGCPARTPRPRERQEPAPQVCGQVLGEPFIDHTAFATLSVPAAARRRRGRRGARGRVGRSGGDNALPQDCLLVGAQPVLAVSPASASCEVDMDINGCGDDELVDDFDQEDDDTMAIGDRRRQTRRRLSQDGAASISDVKGSSSSSCSAPSLGVATLDALALGSLVRVCGKEDGVELNRCLGIVVEAITDAQGRLGVRRVNDGVLVRLKSDNLVNLVTGKFQ